MHFMNSGNNSLIKYWCTPKNNVIKGTFSDLNSIIEENKIEMDI